MALRTPDARELVVWRIDLRGTDAACRASWSVLGPDERARADRFRFAPDRARYILAHGALRTILGDYLGTEPRRLEFQRSPFGKPSLAGFPIAELDFSLSRAGDLMVCVVAQHSRVGIDIEAVDRVVTESDEATYFSPTEREELRRRSADERQHALTVCWTRKEAFIKARGEGLSIPLDAFDVTVYPDPARLLATRPDRTEAARWSLCDLALDPGWVGTIAIEGQERRIRRRDWLDARG